MAREQSEAVRQKQAAERALVALVSEPVRSAKNLPDVLAALHKQLGDDDYEALSALSLLGLLQALTVGDLLAAGVVIARAE